MSSGKSEFESPIRIIYRPPVLLIYFLTFLHLAAILCILISAIPSPFGSILIAAITASYINESRRYLCGRKHPIHLVLHPDSRWLLINRNDDQDTVSEVKLKDGAFVHPLLIVMNFHAEGTRFPIIFTSNNCDGDTMRRLRVRLRFPNR